MPYIPVVDVVQAELFMLWDGSNVENVLHFEPDTPPSLALMGELAAHLVTWWNANIKPLCAPQLQLNSLKLTDLSTEFAPVLNYNTGLPLVGTSATATLPNNVAFVVTKRTALRGRSYRGRIYVAGLTEGAVTGSVVAASVVTAYLNAYNLIKSFSTAGAAWTMQVVSRHQGGVPLINGIATDVTGFTSDGVVDSQRRRLPGRGA